MLECGRGKDGANVPECQAITPKYRRKTKSTEWERLAIVPMFLTKLRALSFEEPSDIVKFQGEYSAFKTEVRKRLEKNATLWDAAEKAIDEFLKEFGVVEKGGDQAGDGVLGTSS